MSDGSLKVSPKSTENVRVELERLRQEVFETKQLMIEVLREMLRIASVQANTTQELASLMRSLASGMSPELIAGGGSSRVITDDSEYKTWREQLAKERRA